MVSEHLSGEINSKVSGAFHVTTGTSPSSGSNLCSQGRYFGEQGLGVKGSGMLLRTKVLPIFLSCLFCEGFGEHTEEAAFQIQQPLLKVLC